MKSLQPFLEHIGLSHHESAVYLHLLQAGEKPASMVASELKIPRSTVRGVLDKLCERAIVAKIYRRNTQYYQCLPPKALNAFLENQKNKTEESISELHTLLPMITALHGQNAVAPKVRFFEGTDQVIEAFNHSLFQEEIDEILFCTSYKFLSDKAIRKNDEDFYIPLRSKKKIKLRVLTGEKRGDGRTEDQDKKELRERRTVPEEYELPGNFHIYGNFVVYFSVHENEYIAILVESSLMAHTMRSMFEFMWRQCS